MSTKHDPFEWVRLKAAEACGGGVLGVVQGL